MWSCEVAYGGSKEDLRDQEADISAGAGKCALSVDGLHRRIFKGYHKDKDSDSLPGGLVSNGQVVKRDLDFSRCGALGEYCNIR